jgi:hypothetical protein
VKKNAACGDMHGNWGHAAMQTESAKVVSIFSSFAILFFCHSEVYYIYIYPKWICTKTPKFLFFLPLQIFFCSSGDFLKS